MSEKDNSYDGRSGFCEPLVLDPRHHRLRSAGFSLSIGNIKITLCDDPDHIALNRDGEGGEFSLREFEAMLHGFISDRL